MILKATSVGELAQSIAAKRERGFVSRIFRNSAYLESGGGLVLLVRGGVRSPVTINLNEGPDLLEVLSANQTFEMRPTSLLLDGLEVRLRGAPVFKSALAGVATINPIAERDVSKVAAALKLLYSASSSQLELVKSEPFTQFVQSVLRPLAGGRPERAYSFSSYAGLVGSGTGFTPAGDDFVAGFTAAFNYCARTTGGATISLAPDELRRETVPESASLIDYAQRGYVDEELERLILAGLGGRPRQFVSQLSGLASRGHTSGLDMSLGVLMLVACVGDSLRRGRALESSLATLAD